MDENGIGTCKGIVFLIHEDAKTTYNTSSGQQKQVWLYRTGTTRVPEDRREVGSFSAAIS
jgi:hypothetical protein